MSAAAKRKAPRPADGTRIKPYVERVAALIVQQKGIGSDISDVCSEAKDVAGLDPTTLRFAARESLMDKAKRDERNDKRDQYLHALGLAVAAVESGEMSARQSAKIFNIGKSSIYKALAVHDVSTGELPRDMVEGDLGYIETRGYEGASHAGESLQATLPSPSLPSPEREARPGASTWAFITAPVLAQLAAEEAERAEREAERERKRAERLALAERNRAIDADPLDFPPHLDRRVAA